MRTFSSTPWRDGTFWEFCFIPVTIKHISPDFTTSLSKPVWSHNRHSNPTIQLSTEDTGSSHIPACITHCAPFTGVLTLNSTGTDVRTVYQPEISVTWTKNTVLMEKNRRVHRKEKRDYMSNSFFLFNTLKQFTMMIIWLTIGLVWKEIWHFTRTYQSYIIVMCAVHMMWGWWWTASNGWFISSALNLLCPHLSVSFVKSSCSQHLYRSPTVQLSTHNLCILLVKGSSTHCVPCVPIKNL